MPEPPETLRAGRIPIASSTVAIGAAYLDVFNRIPGFPESPSRSWREPGGEGELFSVTAPFLGYKPSPLEFYFVAGKLDRILAGDPEGKADGWDGPASKKRALELIAEWAKRLGPPAENFAMGSDVSATWTFGGLQLSIFFETKTPSVGFCARRSASP